MVRLGLTGSIGMGKTETAKLFRKLGVPVFDADKAVHDLYAAGGRAVVRVEREFPGTTVNGAVDRARLSATVLSDPQAIDRLEAIVHPLVEEEERKFLAEAERAGVDIVVLDIPLLFESGRQARVDKIVVVTAPAAVQRRRVLDRPEMTAEKFEMILARQLPDAEKRARADFIVETDKGLEDAFDQVTAIVDSLRSEVATMCRPR